MSDSPLTSPIWLHLGPIPISQPVVTSAVTVLLLATGAAMLTSRLRAEVPPRWQVALELFVTGIEDQLRSIMQTEPRPYLPMLGALFVFIAVSNLSGLLPGVHAPTASLETTAALALIVFFYAQYEGFRRRGALAYLRGFAKPNILMLPLNLLGEVTRTFALMVRLFGNVMSGELVIAIVLALAGLLVPVPLMALELLTGLVQAYIFTVLAAVFIGGAVGTVERA